MSETGRIREIADRLEIQDLLTRYCTALDTKQYDLLDDVFAPDAVLDYTSCGGIHGTLSEAKKWLAEALSLFPVTQHVVANHDIKIDGDRAESRCAFYNPMGLPRGEGEPGHQMFFFGGYYNDKLIRTDQGWRISERIEESVWSFGR